MSPIKTYVNIERAWAALLPDVQMDNAMHTAL